MLQERDAKRVLYLVVTRDPRPPGKVEASFDPLSIAGIDLGLGVAFKAAGFQVQEPVLTVELCGQMRKLATKSCHEL